MGRRIPIKADIMLTCCNGGAGDVRHFYDMNSCGFLVLCDDGLGGD
jgi:hypothetical protein